MPVTPSQPSLADESSPVFCTGRKLGEEAQARLWQWLQDDPECPSRELQAKLAQALPAVEVSLRHLNRLRASWRLNRRKGRPRQTEGR